jgi:hypothetical protein
MCCVPCREEMLFLIDFSPCCVIILILARRVFPFFKPFRLYNNTHKKRDYKFIQRQYGPIHSSKIRGRLVFRLWPWKRHDLTNDEENSYLSSCWIGKKRPVPYSSIDAYIGKRFGLYRVTASSNEILPQRKIED